QSAQAEYFSRKAGLESAQADLASREADLKQAISDYDRLRPLLAQDAISQQEVQTAKTNVDKARASVAAAKAAIKTAQAAVVTAQANIASNEADIRKAETNLSTASTDLGYTTIRAPIDGTVVAVVTEQGTTVNANQAAPTIVTLADLSTVRINAQISEADVINVKAGMPVYFNTIGNPDQKYDAVLTAIEPAPEQISTTSSTDSAIYYIGYVEVPNPERRFRIDMTAQVYVVIDKASNTLMVPSAAIRKGGGSDSSPNGTYVRVLKADESVEDRPVKVGIDNRVNAQILSGLKAGEAVIIGENSGKSGQEQSRRRRPPGM
ncbi:MAG TPA: efflux transporter periplasmic adaptor subunit, partial [Psychrobacter sp.]|nr:efflux transporter periplasmic adaptor subunit [Psychrobacter sp.]